MHSIYSSVVTINPDEDDQNKDKTNQHNQNQQNQLEIDKILKLLEEIREQSNITDADTQIRNILERNKSLLNYENCKDNKLRSILHIAKFDSKLPYDVKLKIVSTIVDVGYKKFEFLKENPLLDNCHALFFVAAKCDYDKLQLLIEYFKDNDKNKLHDTREGDNVLSFMLKFGNCRDENFLQCFQLLLNENVDTTRLDYYKNSCRDIIIKELNFLKFSRDKEIYVKKLNEILKIVKEHNVVNDGEEIFARKINLFNALILDKKFMEILKKNIDLKDCDDGENTLLQLAIIKNRDEIAKELLEKGVNPNLVVNGRNEEAPLILAAKLNREKILLDILRSDTLKVTEEMFVKFITKMKPKYLNYLLESDAIDVNFSYNERTPLFYAVVKKQRTAIQHLLQRGASLTENCLTNINPKDLEDYLNSCVRFDNFRNDMEESEYKSLLVFDFFIRSSEVSETEIESLRKIGSNKRLKHLLEHPLVYIFILLKWETVLPYYYYFVLSKFIFFIAVFSIVYCNFLNIFVLLPATTIQCVIILFNFSEFRIDYRRYTLHFFVEICIFSLLLLICLLKYIVNVRYIMQLSAFIIILISISMLLTLGYHIKLSKWMSMVKRVFKNFTILLLFFIFPILAFAAAFQLLIPIQQDFNSVQNSTESGDFDSLSRAIFRTFVMLGGDIGDKKFSVLSGYIIFVLFTIGMVIIIMNFWTGVAVSDIKEIEEQSTIVAFKNVIVFIESVEKFYTFFQNKVKIIENLYEKLPVPFLKPKVEIKEKKRSKNKQKYSYGIGVYLNEDKQFKHNKEFMKLKLEKEIILKIKSLHEEKELNIGKTFAIMTERIDKIEIELKQHEKYFKNQETYLKNIEELLKTRLPD